MSGDTDDLQDFFDNINKEIEEGSTVVTLTAENVSNLAGGDKAVEKVLLDSVEVSEDESEDFTYFLDDDGNCYKQTSKNFIKKVEATPKHLKRLTAMKANNKTTSTSKPKVVVSTPRNTKKSNKIVVLNDLEFNEESGDDDVDFEIDEVASNSSSTANKSKIYNFDETVNTDLNATAATNVTVVAKKVIKIKPVSVPATPLFFCGQCDYKTNKKFLMSRHVKSHSDERPHVCSVCERAFKTSVALVNHVNVHMGNKPHACKDCDSAFTTSGELLRHVRYKHTGEKPHKCAECGYASVEMSKLRRHIRSHTGERPYQCPHCTYASPDTFKLKRHLRTHTGEKPYECDICKARFTQSNSMKSHRLIHSVVDKPVFQCTLCPTTCGRKADLRMHMQKLHQSDTPINCKRCGKDLPDRYSYKLHIKTHEGEKCYRCKLCPYASVSVRHLESHMLLHTDDKPFKCVHCEQVFRQQQLLRRHMNIYHNNTYVAPEPREKVHTCPHCTRTFTHKGNLMRHMEVHDPTSKTIQIKQELKKGRMVRVKDNNVEEDTEDNVSDDESIEEFVNLEEGILYTEEVKKPVDVFAKMMSNSKTQSTSKTQINKRNKKPKPTNVLLNKTNADTKDVITFRIKQSASQELSVDEDGEGECVVLEMVNEDDTEHNKAVKTIKIDGNNCFGFEVEDEEENYDEEEYEEIETKDFKEIMGMDF